MCDINNLKVYEGVENINFVVVGCGRRFRLGESL